MRFAREGLIFIAIAALLAFAAVILALSRRGFGYAALAFALILVAAWVAYFFRDPERQGERGQNLVISPADGEVVMITEVDEPAFVQAKAKRISIFMNVFDVHVNRYPVSGVVRYVQYNKGKFINAAHEKASLDNEQMSVGLEVGKQRVLVRQIAGLIARRIVNNARKGDSVAQGARMGLIRFGSRVDVFVPISSIVRVEVGDKPLAGTTVLAEMRP